MSEYLTRRKALNAVKRLATRLRGFRKELETLRHESNDTSDDIASLKLRIRTSESFADVEQVLRVNELLKVKNDALIAENIKLRERLRAARGSAAQ